MIFSVSQNMYLGLQFEIGFRLLKKCEKGKRKLDKKLRAREYNSNSNSRFHTLETWTCRPCKYSDFLLTSFFEGTKYEKEKKYLGV